MKNLNRIATLMLLFVSLSFAQSDKSIKWWDVGSNQFKILPIPFIPMDSTLAANVTTPVAGKGNIFIGLDRRMYVKWVGGTVTEIGGANTALSNVANTAVPVNLNPNASNSVQLGQREYYWKGVYTNFGNGVAFNYDVSNAIFMRPLAGSIAEDRSVFVPSSATGSVVLCGSASAPLALNGGTGDMTISNIPLSTLGQSSATTGQIPKWNGTVWAAANDETGSGGLSSLNGLTASTQTFATGTAGTDFGITSTTSTHTFNIPTASATARGLMSTSTQTIAGAKTWNDNQTLAAGKYTIYKGSSNNYGINANNSTGSLEFTNDLGGGSESVQLRLASAGISTMPIFPFGNNLYDVGTSSLRYKDGWFAGNVYGTWAGSTVTVAKGGTGFTSAGSLHSILVNTDGANWSIKIPHRNGTLQAAGDTAFIAVTGLESGGKAFASWGVVGGTDVPLGTLYIKEIGNGYVRVRSNADEQVNLPIIVTITEWAN
jgi:hypothetical protein